ncbi:MAG: hypothetical protein KF729_12495 [Sandaracinaceae bacterium]|nr:hypothetical protein [Sandaracinaceae bacterium]
MRPSRAWSSIAGAGLALALAGSIDAHGSSLAGNVATASRVGFSVIARGELPSAAEAREAHARGAAAYGTARTHVSLVASVLLLVFVFGARARRARSWRELAFHVGLGFASGVVASRVAGGGPEATLWMIAVVLAAALASLPWLLPAELARGLALRRLAAAAHGTSRVRLLRALAAHRRLFDSEALDATARRRAEDALDRLIGAGAPRHGELAGGARRPIEELVHLARCSRSR